MKNISQPSTSKVYQEGKSTISFNKINGAFGLSSGQVYYPSAKPVITVDNKKVSVAKVYKITNISSLSTVYHKLGIVGSELTNVPVDITSVSDTRLFTGDLDSTNIYIYELDGGYLIQQNDQFYYQNG